MAIFAVSVDVLRFGLGLHPIEDLANRDPGPGIAETAPAGDAVDVGDDVLRWQGAELAVVEREGVLDAAEHLEVPGRDVGLRDRAEMKEGPAVRGGEGLARRDPRGVDAFRNPLAFEEECHFASIGIVFFGRCSALWIGFSAGLYWPFPSTHGPVAQLGERVNRTHEARGSNPLGSTNFAKFMWPLPAVASMSRA